VAAFHGHDEYVQSWLEKSCISGRFPSPEVYDALLKANLRGYSTKIIETSKSRSPDLDFYATAFRRSLIWKSQRVPSQLPSSIQDALGHVDNLLAPNFCFPDDWAYGIATISTSALVMELVAVLVESYSQFITSSISTDPIGPNWQNDMEGMLSSLLYQILEEDSDSESSVAASLLQHNPEARRKNSHDDWSLGELQTTLHQALELLQNQYVTYIILDGVDEHLPADEHGELLDSIRRLEQMPRVRLAVSSRRERIFEQQFGHSQQLRLEQLNAHDIYRFTIGSLRRFSIIPLIGNCQKHYSSSFH
jgi:hypothetical protein